MRIAIDCREITNPRIGPYIRQLIRALLLHDDENEYFLYFESRTPWPSMAEIIGPHRNVFARVLKQGALLRFIPGGRDRAFAEQVAQDHPDVFHAPNGRVPAGLEAALVATVHDARHPQAAAIARAADRTIFHSAAAMNTVAELIGEPLNTGRLVRRGFGHGEPRKDAESAFRMLEPLGLGGRPFVVASGDDDSAFARSVEGAILKLADRFPEYERLAVVSDSEVAHEDVGTLMSHASALVTLGRHDHMLEAMGRGIPVITVRDAESSEIVGDAGIHIGLEDELELPLAIKYLMDEPARRSAYGQRGIERAQEHRWDRTAGETLEVYREAVNSR